MDDSSLGRRSALVINCEPSFSEFLRGTLMAYDFAVEVLRGGAEGITRLEAIEPDLVFVGVDLPDKTGFTLCNKIKRRHKVLPVILVTETLSNADIELHSKLKVHADAFLDERTLAHGEFLRRVDELVGLRQATSQRGSELSVGLGVRTPDESPLAVRSRLPTHTSDADPGWVSDLIDETTAALGALEEIDDLEEGPSDGRGRRELELEVERLRVEIEQARRDARSSPFSRDFIDMRELLQAREGEIGRLSDELQTRKKQIAKSKGTLSKISDDLLTALKGKEAELERAKLLAEDLERSEFEVRRARKEIHRLERRAVSDAKSASEGMSRERHLHEETRRDYEERLAKVTGRLNELERETRQQDEARAGLVRQHQEEIAEQRRCHLEELAEKEKKSLEELRRVAQEHQDALSATEARRNAEQAEGEQRRQLALEKTEERFQRELEAVSERSTAALVEVEAARCVFADQVEELKKGHAREIQDTKQVLDEERRQSRETRRRLQDELAQLREVHDKAQEGSDTKHAEELRALRQELDKQAALRLAEAQGRNEEELVQTRMRFQSELEAVGEEHQATLAEVEEARRILSARVGEVEQALEEAKRLGEEVRLGLGEQLAQQQMTHEVAEKRGQEQHVEELGALEERLTQEAEQGLAEAEARRQQDLARAEELFARQLKEMVENRSASLMEIEETRRSLRGELEDLERNHAEALEQKNQALAAEKRRHLETRQQLDEATRRFESQEREVLEASTEAHGQELQDLEERLSREKAWELERAEKNRQKEVAEVKERLKAVVTRQAATLSELDAEAQSRKAERADLEASRAELNQRTKALREEQERHAQTRRQLEQEASRRIDQEQAEKQQAEKRVEEIAALESRYNELQSRQLSKVEEKHTQDRTTAEARFAADLEVVKEKHDRAMTAAAANQESAATQLSELQRDHARELEGKDEALRLEEKRHAETQEQLRLELSQLATTYEEADKETREQHAEVLKTFEETLGRERDSAVAELVERHAAEVEALKLASQQALTRAQSRQRVLMAEAEELRHEQALLTRQGEEAMAKGERVHQDLVDRYEAKIAQLEKRSQAEVLEVTSAHAAKLVELQGDLERERQHRQGTQTALAALERERAADGGAEEKLKRQLEAFKRQHDSIVVGLKAAANAAAAEIEELKDKHEEELRYAHRATEEERRRHEQSRKELDDLRAWLDNE